MAARRRNPTTGVMKTRKMISAGVARGEPCQSGTAAWPTPVPHPESLELAPGIEWCPCCGAVKMGGAPWTDPWWRSHAGGG